MAEIEWKADEILNQFEYPQFRIFYAPISSDENGKE